MSFTHTMSIWTDRHTATPKSNQQLTSKAGPHQAGFRELNHHPKWQLLVLMALLPIQHVKSATNEPEEVCRYQPSCAYRSNLGQRHSLTRRHYHTLNHHPGVCTLADSYPQGTNQLLFPELNSTSGRDWETMTLSVGAEAQWGIRLRCRDHTVRLVWDLHSILAQGHFQSLSMSLTAISWHRLSYPINANI